MSEMATWQQLSSDIADGSLELRVHRDAFDAAVKGLQEFIVHIEGLRRYVAAVSNVTGFGGFQMGVDLANKFTQKASGDESIRQRLQEVVEEAKAAQDVLRKAVAAYIETDAEFAQEYQGIQL